MTPLRILVTGGRFYADRAAVYQALDIVHARRGIAVLIHGACHLGGADKLAADWAVERGVPVEAYPVDTKLDGPWPAAGNKRNGRMLRRSAPDGVVALPGQTGTANMVKRAKAADVKVWEPYPATS